MPNHALIISCEHASNAIPVEYASLFAGADTLLNSHAGWDPGALSCAEMLASQFNAPLFAGSYSRLLIDLNRSAHHPRRYSSISRNLSKIQRQQLHEQIWQPFREAVHAAVAERLKQGQPVLHLSVHSFAPQLNGVTRNADLGLLYDPARLPEAQLAKHWQSGLQNSLPQYRIRCNYPYRGSADGHTTALRKRWSANQYLGLELELNQSLLKNGRLPKPVVTAIIETLKRCINSLADE